MEPPPRRDNISLFEAFLAHVTHESLEYIAEQERHFTYAELDGSRILRVTKDNTALRQMPRSTMEPPPYFEPLLIAWDNAIERGFRQQVLHGKLTLTGIVLTPDLGQERVPLPAAYAREMDFDFAANEVELLGRRYVFIEATAVEMEEATIPMATAKRRRTGGPECYNPLIREAVITKWNSLQRDGEPAEKWTAMAGWIRKYLEQLYPQRKQSGELPAVGTIRTRLPMIYHEVCNDRSARMTSISTVHSDRN